MSKTGSVPFKAGDATAIALGPTLDLSGVIALEIGEGIKLLPEIPVKCKIIGGSIDDIKTSPDGVTYVDAQGVTQNRKRLNAHVEVIEPAEFAGATMYANVNIPDPSPGGQKARPAYRAFLESLTLYKKDGTPFAINFAAPPALTTKHLTDPKTTVNVYVKNRTTSDGAHRDFDEGVFISAAAFAQRSEALKAYRDANKGQFPEPAVKLALKPKGKPSRAEQVNGGGADDLDAPAGPPTTQKGAAKGMADELDDL